MHPATSPPTPLISPGDRQVEREREGRGSAARGREQSAWGEMEGRREAGGARARFVLASSLVMLLVSLDEY